MKKKSKFLQAFLTTATLALFLGAMFKLGLSVYNFKVDNGNLVAQAQPNTAFFSPNENKATPTLSTIQQSQYIPETQSQNSQDIKMTVSNFYVEGNHVFVDVCYDLPGKDIWDINIATLEYGGKSTGNFAVEETSIDIAKDKPTQGIRCLRLDFYDIDANADFSSFTLTIVQLGQISPAEGHECEEFLARINSNEKVNESGIKVVCEQHPSGTQIKTDYKPDNISDEDANILIYDAMFNLVNGDWVFTATQNK